MQWQTAPAGVSGVIEAVNMIWMRARLWENCSPMAPLSQHFAQGENLVSIFI